MKTARTKSHTAVPVPVRLNGESPKWYSRFLKYVLLPACTRSLEHVHKNECKTASHGGASGSAGQQRPPGAWHRAFVSYKWEDRATVFDAAIFAAEAQAHMLEVTSERSHRRAVVRKLLKSAEHLVDDYAVLRSSPAAASAFIARALEAHFRDYGADPLPEDRKSGAGSMSPTQAQVAAITFVIEGGEPEEDEIIPLGPGTLP